MVYVIRIALLPFLLLGLFGIVNGQEITFTATVDRNTIAAGDPVQFTITLTNAQGSFNAPDLGGMVVLQGPFESTNVNFFNGRMIASVSRSWRITATSPGKYTIGSAKARVGGGVLETDPITIEVAAATARPQDPQASQGQKRDNNLFITINLNRNKGYVGEQIVATYTLYSRYPSVDLSKYDLPKLNGFWSEEVNLGNTSWEDKPETINGVQYRVAVLKRQILFPQRGGKLRIEPFTLSCVVNRSFFNRGTAIDVVSNAVEFTALELPGQAPSGFTGAVGELQMTVKADRTEVKADEAIELTVRISGRSNLKLLEGPAVEFPSDFEVYDPKVTDKITVNGGGMSGQREFQYLVIPRYEGTYDLDPITFSYFDPKSGAYRTLRSDGLSIEVAPGAGGPSATIQRPSKTDVKAVGTDIRYIRTGPVGLRPKGELLFGSPHWWAGMATPALGFLLLLAWRRRHLRDSADVVGMRRKRADREARKRLEQAHTALRQDAKEEFHGALSKALHGYLADKFGLGVAEVSSAQLGIHLGRFPGGDALAKEYAALLATCDMARFAPVEERPRKELYDQSVALIGRTEQLIRA
jgi:hypothetical protein